MNGAGSVLVARRVVPPAVVAAAMAITAPAFEARPFDGLRAAATAPRASFRFDDNVDEPYAEGAGLPTDIKLLEQTEFLDLSLTAPPTRAAALFRDYEGYQHQNWDGFGAQRISAEVLSIACELINSVLKSLPLPDAAPGADGTIGLEWWNGDSRVFVDVGPTREVRTYIQLVSGEDSEEQFQWGDSGLVAHFDLLFRKLYGDAAISGGGLFASTVSTFYGARASELINRPWSGTYGFVRLRTKIT